MRDATTLVPVNLKAAAGFELSAVMTRLSSARIRPDWAFPAAVLASSIVSPIRRPSTGWRPRTIYYAGQRGGAGAATGRIAAGQIRPRPAGSYSGSSGMSNASELQVRPADPLAPASGGSGHR